MTAQPAEPRVRFVIGGVQKAGTSALARYLGRHPGLCLPRRKEAHVFDAPDFDDAWTPAQVDARYAPLFDEAPAGAMHGDATPFYLFKPRTVERIARYNPAMRWIVLLRDPIERALSHYHMERSRGHESLPLWLALLAERWRLRGHEEDFARGSPLRRYSYRARGDYARQIDALHARFPREQVLLLRSDALIRDPRAVILQACDFLGTTAPQPQAEYERVFVGDYAPWAGNDWRKRLLRRWWRDEFARQARQGIHWESA